MDAVIKFNPTRAVAYLNRGDIVYMKAKNTHEDTEAYKLAQNASADYQRYVKLMEEKCMHEEIPARVFESQHFSKQIRCTYEENLQLYHNYMRAGQLAEALQLRLDRWSETTCNDLSQSYIKAAHKKAVQTHQSGDMFTAMAISSSIIHSTIIFSCDPAMKGYHLYASYYSEYGIVGRDNYVQNTRENVTIMNDLAFFIDKGGSHYEAVEVLAQVIVLDPDRAVAYLNRADIIYEHPESYIHESTTGIDVNKRIVEDYETYLTIMKKRVNGTSTE